MYLNGIKISNNQVIYLSTSEREKNITFITELYTKFKVTINRCTNSYWKNLKHREKCLARRCDNDILRKTVIYICIYGMYYIYVHIFSMIYCLINDKLYVESIGHSKIIPSLDPLITDDYLTDQISFIISWC